MTHLRLGMNIDHVATLRNARGGLVPDPIRAALVAARAGADGITAHLREDRRHITDRDMERLKAEVELPLNMEMAATEEMLAIACRILPHAACIVPEKREEVTTEGGLDVAGQKDRLRSCVERLSEKGIRVSLFVDPEERQIHAAHEIGAPVIELHTGSYCAQQGNARQRELKTLIEAARLAEKLGLECHAGHGLTFSSVGAVAAIPSIKELNIGHFIVAESVFMGLEAAIRKMRDVMDEARRGQVA